MLSFLKTALLTGLCLLMIYDARATHIVGGEFTYAYKGDTVIAGIVKKKYVASLSIYEDCLEGDDRAINNDNPAYMGVFDGNGALVQMDTNIYYTERIRVPRNFDEACVDPSPSVCILKTTFYKTYYLAPNASGYTIAYQRCCRNGSITNILNPGNTGVTYTCTIPPASVGNNSSPVFRNYPPLVICNNTPLNYDNGATDANGDSLVYSFCNSNNSDPSNDKPLPVAPPYTTVAYMSPFSSGNPMNGAPAIRIDAATGRITGTPNRLGRYLVTVCCDEYRNGTLIATTRREFQFVVTGCRPAVRADMPTLPDMPDTYIIDCEDLTVKFRNTSRGGSSYRWDFGAPGAAGNTSTEFEPEFTYPDTGTYTVKLLVNPGSNCADSIQKLVKVYPRFRAAFEYNGLLCPGNPISFVDISESTIKPISYWSWFFGDGATASVSAAQHSYSSGGTYNVVLVAGNARGCRDTAVKQLVVQQFRPFAGDDTLIVKGEYIDFHATGGVNYLWRPGTRLNDTMVYNPRGYYPDTGRYEYVVMVESAYGCRGSDTIRVGVLNNAYFVVPNAFSPNGDGLNDVFRPLAVGYSDLKFFRVFNRFGQEVYASETLETGWNGTFKGVPAELGVYYWVIRYVDRFGTEGMMKGDVTLVR